MDQIWIPALVGQALNNMEGDFGMAGSRRGYLVPRAVNPRALNVPYILYWRFLSSFNLVSDILYGGRSKCFQVMFVRNMLL